MKNRNWEIMANFIRNIYWKLLLKWFPLWILCIGIVMIPVRGVAGTTGKIAGQVVDAQTKEPLIGVNIYTEGYPYGAATDEDGFYFILNVPPGKYTLVAQMIGYHEVKVTDVLVKVDRTTKVNFELQSESIQLGQEIVVVAKRPLIQKDVTSTDKTVTSEEIQALPVENFNEVVNLQAGVVAGHFRGGRLGEVAYMIDGIPVNDPFNNSIGIEVENAAIQELEIISGTFNAEYGQAMSGVVNIVTKEGGNRYDADINAYLGNYYTRHSNIFPNLEDLNKFDSGNLQMTLSGPVPFLRKIKFFATGRLFEDDGYIYGRRVYNILDSNPYAPTGDSSWVPMNDYKRKSFNVKLTYYLLPTLKINYSFIWDDNKNHYYDHAFRLTPDGIMTHYRNNRNQSLVFNHTISKSTFHTLKISRNYSNYKGYVFEDPFDPRYVIPEQGLPQSAYTFRSGGNQNGRYRRYTITDIIKWDLTTQFDRYNKIGLGVIFRRHDIYNFWTSFQSRTIGFDPNTLQEIREIVYPGKFTPGYEEYEKKPIEFSAYVQDKMEYENLVINFGLRFDYFDPRTNMPADIRNPEFNPLFPRGNRKVSAKTQLSPRLGIAFPISANGVIHVSYGHFFQIPNFEHLYQGINDFPDGTTRFLISKAGLNTLIGNPDLDGQRTVMYEIGLRQVLYTNLVLEFTAYYRDIRNWVDTEIIETYDKSRFARYINRDYGNVRGIIISLEKRLTRHWGARLDYTYQFAEGNASDPRTVFFDNQTDPPIEPEKKLIRLDWDQRSTLNFSLTVGTPGSWNIGLIGQIGSGTPYTADLRWIGANVNFRNNRKKPSVVSFDLRAEKMVELWGLRFKTFLLAYNIFDRLNEYGVYGSTGRANRDLNVKFAGDIYGLNTIEEYVNNPSFYSAPRLIRMGISLQLK